MAQWSITDTKDGTLEPVWDDGLKVQPWEDGFTTERVVEYAGEDNFSFMGVPNWEPPESAADADPAGAVVEGEGSEG